MGHVLFPAGQESSNQGNGDGGVPSPAPAQKPLEESPFLELGCAGGARDNSSLQKRDVTSPDLLPSPSRETIFHHKLREEAKPEQGLQNPRDWVQAGPMGLWQVSCPAQWNRGFFSAALFRNLTWGGEASCSLVQPVPGAGADAAGMGLQCVSCSLEELQEVFLNRSL